MNIWAVVHRYLDALVSPTVVEPAARGRMRFLAGGAIVGLLAALPSAIGSGAAELTWQPVIITAYGACLVVQLASIRAGVSPQRSSVGALLLNGAFLFAMSLTSVELTWSQVNWLVLLPLIALLLDDFDSPVARPTGRRLFALASVGAAVLGLATVLFHRLGWTLGVPEPEHDQAFVVASAVDLVVFLVSVTGLLLVQQFALMRAEREVERLRDLLPMCAWCRRLRDDDTWVTVEQYVATHQATGPSNTICPTCAQRLGIDDVRMPV